MATVTQTNNNGIPPVPGNPPNTNNPQGNPTVPTVAQQALGQGQAQGQGPGPLPSNVSNVGNQMNNADQGEIDGQDPNQASPPSPFMMIASMVVKFAIPILLGIAGAIVFGAALSAASTVTAPFILLCGGILLLTVGSHLGMNALNESNSKDYQISKLNSDLEKANKEKENISSIDALKKETIELTKQIKEKKTRVGELAGLRNGGTLLNEKQRKELARLEKEINELKSDRKKKRKCIKKLEKPNQHAANPAARPAGNPPVPAVPRVGNPVPPPAGNPPAAGQAAGNPPAPAAPPVGNPVPVN